jgi:hypothetical protein
MPEPAQRRACDGALRPSEQTKAGRLQFGKMNPLESERRNPLVGKSDRIGGSLSHLDRCHILQNLAKRSLKRAGLIVAREKLHERRSLGPVYRT